MNTQTIIKPTRSHLSLALRLVLVVAALFTVSATVKGASFTLQGQSQGSPTWITSNLQNWRELDYIPCRLLIQGGPLANQTITITFPHLKGTTPGFQDLTGFTSSPNAVITSAPVLSAPEGQDWSYTFTVTVTDGNPASVMFLGRLAAGSHMNTGSSLRLSGSPSSMGNLQVHKPSPGPGYPNLSIVKSGPETAAVGDVINYTLTYTNTATGTNIAIGSQISDILPPQLTAIPASVIGGQISGNTIFWDLGNIAPGASGSISFQAIVGTNAVFGQSVTNIGQILSSEDDANYSDNISKVITTLTVNRPPVATNDFYTTPEDTALTIPAPGVLGNDTDPESNALTATSASTPNHGAVTLSADGSFTYTPAANYNGPDSFTYVANDGTTNSTAATVAITVTPVNDAPVANGQDVTTPEDTAKAITLTGSDLDGDSLTFSVVNSPTHGTLSGTAPNLTYTPALNYNGPDSFTFIANDGTTNSTAATVAITVTPVNDAPSFVKGSNQFVTQNASVQNIANWATSISPGPADEASQTVTFQVGNNNNALFAVQPAVSANGTLTFTPGANAHGTATVTVVAHDDGGTANGGVDTSAPQTFAITVNSPPTVSIVSPTNGAVFIGPATFTVAATAADVDGTVAMVELFSGTNLLAKLTNGEPYFVTLTNVMAGTYKFSARATDNLGSTGVSQTNLVTVATELPTTFAVSMHLNPRNSLYEQTVRIYNPTYKPFPAVRVYISNLSPQVRVYNISGVENGLPYVQTYPNATVAPGSFVDLVIQYYATGGVVPNPTLFVEPV